MLYIACFIWLSTFVKVESNNDRKVKVALETVIKFEQPGLRSGDNSILDNMQSFINKVRGAINPDDDEISRRKIQKTTQEKHIVDYLEKALTIVLSYDDHDVKSLARILNEEIKKYHYKGCKFYELANDRRFRRAMRQLLDDLEKAPASVIRFQLTNALNSLKRTNDLDKQLIDFVNSLYSKDSKEKLSRVVNNLQFYKIRARANGGSRGLTLQKVVGDAMKDIVFDHYSSLNDNARRALVLHVNAYLGDVFKPNRQNIARAQTKRNFAHFIGFEEINKLFRMPTTPEKEKTKARRVTKALTNSRIGLQKQSNERSSEGLKLREGTDADKEMLSDSLNEETEAETSVESEVKASVMEAIRKKIKKVKTTTFKNLAKRFHTQKNAEAMRTIWEEIQTLPPMSSAKTLERSPPKERIIFEEHNAVINIGSWRDGPRDSSSEKSLKFRAGDVKLEHDLKQSDKSTDVSDHEGLTLEFDGNTGSNKNIKSHSLRKHIYSGEMTQSRAVVKNSDDFSGDATSSVKYSKNKNEPKVKKLSDGDDSKESQEIDSENKVTAALALEENWDEDWNARKHVAQKNKSGFNEQPTETTSKPKLPEMSTISLSDEDDQLTPTLKEVTREENAKDNKKEQGSEDDFAKLTVENKKPFVEATTKKNVKHSEKIEDDQDSDTGPQNHHTKHLKKDDALENMVKVNNFSYTTPASLLNLETTTAQSSESDSKEEKRGKVKETPNATAENIVKTTQSEFPKTENDNLMKFYAKENAIEELKQHDEDLTVLVKELDEAGEKGMRYLGSAENGVKDKASVMPWEDNKV